jgi:anti-sigma28 factor (negative regulator of flagellin synthesis)
VNANRKKILEVLEETPELRKDKIAMLRKAIAEGSASRVASEVRA